MAEPLLSSRTCARATVRSSSPTTSASPSTRRAACHHRPQRRGQDDPDSPDLRHPSLGFRMRSCSPVRTSPLCRCRSGSDAGLARSFQITSILPGFSALENVALAVQARSGSSFRFFGDASQEKALNGLPWTASTRVGLAARASRPRRPAVARREAPARTGHGAGDRGRSCCCSTSRWPAPGTRNRQRVIETLRRLKGRLTIVLIEHDMEAVFASPIASASWSTAA